MWKQAIHCSPVWQNYCKNISLAYIVIHLKMLKNPSINHALKVKETHESQINSHWGTKQRPESQLWLP